MKLIKKKVFKFFAFILAGLTLATTATPFIVSCSKSSYNSDFEKQDRWWPKDVFFDDYDVGIFINNYFTKLFRERAPSTIKLISLEKAIDNNWMWDQKIAGLQFTDFNKLSIYADPLGPKDGPEINDLTNKENSEKISLFKIYSYGMTVSPKKTSWYYKRTNQKLKAFKDDKEATIPVYEVYAKINFPAWIEFALYMEELYGINKNRYPCSTVAGKIDFEIKNVKLKFKIAIAEDEKNFGNLTDSGNSYYINNHRIRRFISKFESGDPNYPEPPNDGNYDW